MVVILVLLIIFVAFNCVTVKSHADEMTAHVEYV